MKTLKRYLEVYRVQIKNNWVRQAIYRTNFLTIVLTDLVWMFFEVTFFRIIYANTPTLAGWTQPQIYFFLGIFFASDALFTTFFQNNFWNFSNLVNKGELDLILTRPIQPLFLALSRSINITAPFNLILGLTIAIRFAGPAGFPGGAHWLLVFFWLLIGLFATFLLRFTFSVCIFWTERAWAISHLYYRFFAFATKPDSLYPKAIRYLIITALPFALIASVPARALLFGLSTREYCLVFGVLAGFSLLNWSLWTRGLQRYESSSS